MEFSIKFVYSLSTNTSWTIHTDETQSANNVFNVGQFQPFYLRAGVYGLALIPDQTDQAQNQLLGSRLSEAVFTCPVSKLQQEGWGGSGGMEKLGVDKPGHAGGLASTDEGEVFLVTLDTSEVYFFNNTEVRSNFIRIYTLVFQ